MVTSPIAQSITRRAALAGAAGVALAGCANNPSGGSAPANGDSKVPRRNPASEPVTTINTAHGLATMWPDEPIEIEVTNGTLAGVVVTDAAGEPVPGSVQEGQWRPDRGALLVRSSYQVTATATDAAGRSHQTTADISTVNPELVVEVDFRYADGAPVGNGMPIWVRFDMPIREDQRAAIEKAASVTTNPPQQGGWGWVDETTLQWRPRTYWEPGSTAHVEVNAAGLPGGDTWVLADASADYHYGDLRVLQANIDTHTLTCLRNGEVVQILPVSMGKPGYETMTGTKIIMEKQNPVIMDSESYGVPHSDPEGYRITAYWAQRVTWSGEYFHAAPWADYAHGNSNVSHGCTGLTNGNAEWLYNFTLVGDPAEFTGSTFPVQAHQTFGGWTYSWEEWQQLSALA
ncbi:MAG: Ig-like domain-containing protein [Brooklawnia sp.]|uniref:L,D-transpeptidase n=1 Tax=Brooklawnia sp. TaxID=2699740 RepID=UPI003C76E654